MKSYLFCELKPHAKVHPFNLSGRKVTQAEREKEERKKERKKEEKQAGAELCQAQAQVGLPA